MSISRREIQVQTEELIFDILAFRSILFKMQFDECAENESLFVQMLNEAGYRTVTGKEFSLMGYRKMMERADNTKLRIMVDKLMHDPIVVNLEV
jgi:hypothetical protein